MSASGKPSASEGIAYLRQLRAHPPARDPDGFRRLREAFLRLAPSAQLNDQALAAAVEAAELDAPVSSPAELERADAPQVLPPAIVVKLGTWGRAAAASDRPGSAVAKARPATLSEVNEEVIALIQAGKVGAARDLARLWSRRAASDHREVSRIDAQRWALISELVDVARKLPGSLRRAIADGIARDDLSVAHAAAESHREQYPSEADKLAQEFWKRAPDLHKALGGRLQSRRSGGETREPSERGSFRLFWLIIVLSFLALVRVTSCDEQSRTRDFELYDTAAQQWPLPPPLPAAQYLAPSPSQSEPPPPWWFDRTLAPPTLDLPGRPTADETGAVEPRPR